MLPSLSDKDQANLTDLKLLEEIPLKSLKGILSKGFSRLITFNDPSNIVLKE